LTVPDTVAVEETRYNDVGGEQPRSVLLTAVAMTADARGVMAVSSAGQLYAYRRTAQDC